MDVAASIQKVTEEIVLRLARSVHRELSVDYLCLAGGVALNCVANGRVLREGPFRDIWIQPAAGDAGGALGAALLLWHQYHGQPRSAREGDAMRGAFLGPGFSDREVQAQLDGAGAVYQRLEEGELLDRVARLLAEEAVIGWFQGRMEFGPRALGGRSILGDPRSPKMQSVMNLKIKYRESFRPFAPAVLAECAPEYFELDRPSPYMLIVAPVREELRIAPTAQQQQLTGIDRLNTPRSTIPAVTHVDYSARVQTIHRETNPRFHALLQRFRALTGSGVLVNTSFNVRSEPIVCTPAEAYRCFMRTEMDYLAVGDYLLAKTEQPQGMRDDSWIKEFEPD
jgi:carbamoyltransferase